MRKIEKALDKLLELDEVLLHFEVTDPYLWIKIALKYLREADSAEEFYNEEVVDICYITDKKLNYKGAFLHINQHLIIDTRHSCIRVVDSRADGQEFKTDIPNNLQETLVMSLDNIARKAYNESKGK